ncbi:hypothetical protein [Leifsonia shinshuensis]
MASRASSDEHYVLDLLDDVVGAKGLRQHRFDWLLGDPSPSTGRRRRLPVDGYWPTLRLVVEYWERQHDSGVPLWDGKPTASGTTRGEQRALYDERRVELVPKYGLQLMVIRAAEFPLRRHRIDRDPGRDRRIVTGALERAGIVLTR